MGLGDTGKVKERQSQTVTRKQQKPPMLKKKREKDSSISKFPSHPIPLMSPFYIYMTNNKFVSAQVSQSGQALNSVTRYGGCSPSG
jgi:hypothetical protein